jgi:acyl carrier protein
MNLFERLREAVAATLNVPEESITPESTSEDIAAWDSLAQVNLMMTLEQTFDVALEVEDFARLTSIPAILEYLGQHGAQHS